MNGNTITATLKQPRAKHTEQRNVMLPTDEDDLLELEHVIKVTHRWNDLLARMESQKRLPELRFALEAIPVGDERDSRLASVLWRMKKRTDALNTLGRHRNSVLAKAWDMSFRILMGQFSTVTELQELEQQVAQFGPLDGRQVTLEGFERAHISLATGYVNLGMRREAQRHMEIARKYIFVLQDFMTDLVLRYDEARLDMNEGQFDDAIKIYKDLLTLSKESRPLLYDTVALMMVWGCWLTGEKVDLPDWATRSLLAIQDFQAANEEHPPYKVVNVVSQAIANLGVLQSHWQTHLPIYCDVEMQSSRDVLVNSVVKLKLTEQDEIGEFLLMVCRALAYSMQGNIKALEELGALDALKVGGLRVLACLKAMLFLQVHMGLPKAEPLPGLENAVFGAMTKFLQLSQYERGWVVEWLARFMPYALWAMGKLTSDVQVQTELQNLLYLDASRTWVQFKGKHLKRYPKRFMNTHIVHLLHGKELDRVELIQARRHVNALENIKVPISGIVYEAVLRHMQPKINCNLFER